LGRGFGNVTEIVRASEFQRSVEQGGTFGGTDVGTTTGFVRGVNRTVARTAVGVYEVATFPLPPYGPVATGYLSPKPLYPDGYRPRQSASPIFATDHYLGFSGGDVAPWFPGSRFRIFDN
jgi:putative exosortase-associated protein (TIGR04073 family)